MTAREVSVFDPQIAASVPHEIVACARKVELWFESQNIKSWKMGNLQSRSDDDEMTDDTKALVLRLRSHRTWVSSEGMLTTVDHDCAEAAAAIERLERELAEARRDGGRWETFVELWHASTELAATQDEDGSWSITVVEAVEAMPSPGHWTGDTPDAAIDAAIAKERR